MRNDAELVAGVLAGDREAFAALYDRYADRLYDFCVSVLRDRHEAEDAVQDTFVLVAQRLGQLNDPERLRPWLYAVARSVALRRVKARGRVVLDTEVSDMVDPDAGPQRAAELAALRELVWGAAAGLSERDRSLLDLHLRHGLDGAELGEAMGVSANHAYVLLTRLRDQVERSLGALLIARLGREDCAELNDLLSGWDGKFSPLMRKRVARHVDKCAVCEDRRRAMVSPFALLAAIPMLTAPLYLRDRVVDEVELVAHQTSATSPGVTPVPPPADPRRPSRIPMAAAGVALLLVLGLALVWNNFSNEPGIPLAQDLAPTTTSPTGTGQTSTSPPPATSTTTTTAPPTTTTTTTRRVAPPVVTTTTTTNPPQPPPPPPEEPPRDTAPPQVVGQSATPPRIFAIGCQPPNTKSVQVTATDNVAVAGVTLRWTHSNGQTGSKAMTRDGDWFASFGPFPAGRVTWSVLAADAAGNTGTGKTETFSVENCIIG
ncbi:MAG TPA: sigma-70 family RNA polymerase sigma factor [Actinophytocola sp.]|uniref:sigma-70 family RNA polymerase sigma factor n=1 Tax=Actinophytocola sp. TaxID=1872138 RepID=UPI002DBCE7FE|nr:sigma-70 family RNA polymerase sigma factor [Actinophytocola sp.]HEU5472341.1 sigma-70 family RNA polymerase sigma factor [Actinophytocola sp.]